MPIHKKLLDFQKKNIKVEKVGENPHFHSTYATLNEVLDKVKEPLNEVGILILQTPEKDGLRTILLDTTDETKVESFLPYVEVSTAQKLGSNNTYNRRYALVTMLGLEDEDDDGNVASGLKKNPKKAPAQTTDNSNDEPAVLCNHGIPAKKAMSRSTANPNRWFYACSKTKSEQCNFFQWETEGDYLADEQSELEKAEGEAQYQDKIESANQY